MRLSSLFFGIILGIFICSYADRLPFTHQYKERKKQELCIESLKEGEDCLRVYITSEESSMMKVSNICQEETKNP
jgi:hypothetical protein